MSPDEEKRYVWYVGYGSNLCEGRFLCYIRGGKFKFGGGEADGCKDKTPPKESKHVWIPYRLYFAGKSILWGNKGVAFISPCKEPDKSNWTVGRMWKITKEQYEEVKCQEGPLYNAEIQLGEEDGIPICTFTNYRILTPNRPSEGYLKTIAVGLKETVNWTSEKIFQYLKGKDGIRGQIDEDELFKIIESATSSD